MFCISKFFQAKQDLKADASLWMHAGVQTASKKELTVLNNGHRMPQPAHKQQISQNFQSFYLNAVKCK